MFKPGTKGFSLIELMVVISIIGVLVVIGISFSQDMIIRAKISEVKLNVKSASTMVESYTINEEGANSAALLSTNDRSTGTSCNTNNPFGFRIGDCRKLNFVYFGVAGNQSNVHAFEGWEETGTQNISLVYKNTGCSNTWIASKGEIYTFRLEPDNCMKSYDLWRNNYGGSGPAGDYSGDGNVNAADYTVWRSSIIGKATPY